MYIYNIFDHTHTHTSPITSPESLPLLSPNFMPFHLIQFVLSMYEWVWDYPLEHGLPTEAHIPKGN